MHTNNHTDLQKRFPELKDPENTLERISDAFVAPEYARAGFGLIRGIVRRLGHDARFGLATVVTAPEDYMSMVVTISKWWFLNFHIAEAEALEEGDDVEPLVPLDYETALERQKDEDEDESEEEETDEDEDEDEDEEEEEEYDEDEIVEATFYQVGTFLLDSTIIPHETIFDREDLDCYAYDYPEERVEAERFYWARLVWEPEDLSNEDLVASLQSAAAFVLTHHGDDMPFAEYHDTDFAQLILDEALCERMIGAADFGDVVVIEGNEG